MLENEFIGIAGVFVLTLCLIALYHLLSAIGHHSKTYGAQSKQIKQTDRYRTLDDYQYGVSKKDDSWLLWCAEADAQAGIRSPRFGGRVETKRRSADS